MAEIQPMYVVPVLVEQPTWGGEYIAAQKKLSHPWLAGKRIGQSFELFSQSWLTPATTPTFGFATPAQISNPNFADPSQPRSSLASWIKQDLVATLGQKAADRGWQQMQVLIKFTQAQNNSYQVHVRPGQEFGKWLAKPESWYFAEAGVATLGLRQPAELAAYRQRCLEIDQEAQRISAAIKAGQLTVAAARSQLQSYIDQDHPRRFVHTVDVPKGSVIDLSQGGTHHSWEKSSQLPAGNIVYEVQVDVQDEFCTLRSFDQGNLKDDGSVRPLTIDEYFQALDTSAAANDPSRFFAAAVTTTDQEAEITSLFCNQYYVTEQLAFRHQYQGQATQPTDSFHHLYALDEAVVVEVGDQLWSVPAHWSFFIPAQTGPYRLRTQSHNRVLITHL